MISKDYYIQFFKFALVGVTNTVVGLSTYYLLLYIDCNYIIANIIANIISIYNAYYWNNRYVFKNSNLWWKTLCKTYMSYSFTSVVSTILLYYLVDELSFSEVIAPVFVLIVTIPLNFILNKFWTFKNK